MSTVLSAPQQYPTSQPSPETPDWKQLLAERLEAHRAKSGAQMPTPATNIRIPSPGSRASHIARAVASRYATQPTYSEVVAATLAEQAARQEQERLAAEAAAQARRDATAQAERAADAVQQTEPESPRAAEAAGQNSALPLFSSMASDGPAPRTVPGTAVMPQFAERSREMRLHQTPKVAEPTLEELLAVSTVEPRSFLPSKLIEFPRELVSTHKSRPRLPDEPRPAVPPEITEQEASQLRIFEVHPELDSRANEASQSAAAAAAEVREEPKSNVPVTEATSGNARKLGGERQASASNSQPHLAPASATASRMANRPGASSSSAAGNQDARASMVQSFQGLEWAAISLDRDPAAYTRKREASRSDSLPFLAEAASIDRRVMAFAVDFAFVSAAFLGFLAVFAAATPRLPTGLPAVILAGTVYAALWLLYQMLFFSLSGATAGMLYARIALCTFDDQNPSRSALRRRLAAWWLSCLPLGLGFFWSFLDEDNLSWHDRMTGMYQRTY